MIRKASKIIYLSGGGNERSSYPIDRFFFEDIPKNGTLLYIPIALREHKLFHGAENWFRNVLKLHGRHKNIALEVWNELNKENFSDLGKFDAVYVGGGNTWNLMKEISESGFKEFLLKYIESGGIYYGGSAGAIICGARIDANEDENTAGWRGITGMNILNGISIVCHVKQSRLDELRNIAKEKKLHLLALAEGAGAIVRGTSYKYVGEGLCEEF